MKIIKTDPNEQDAILLLEELSKSLERITGNSGKHSFDPNDVCVPRSLFVVAYDENNLAAGCGGIRPISDEVAEVKRMYAKVKTIGVGTKILNYLEQEAKSFGYSTLWVETRLINEQAVEFYKRKGYIQIPNYGKYAESLEAICFEKKIS